MDQILTEPKAQRWRVVAITRRMEEALLLVGSNLAEVKEGYGVPWAEYFNQEGRDYTRKLMVQKWSGTADCGDWADYCEVPIPKEDPRAEARIAG